jgi:hypothetical protein
VQIHNLSVRDAEYSEFGGYNCKNEGSQACAKLSKDSSVEDPQINNLPLPRILGQDRDESEDLQFHIIGVNGPTAYSLVGLKYSAETTLYFFRDGQILSGKELMATENGQRLMNRLPRGTKILDGYFYGGSVTPDRSAYAITGALWSAPTTYYQLPNGTFKTGDEVDPTRIPLGTIVLYQY